jgi:hypothetical protein
MLEEFANGSRLNLSINGPIGTLYVSRLIEDSFREFNSLVGFRKRSLRPQVNIMHEAFGAFFAAWFAWYRECAVKFVG